MLKTPNVGDFVMYCSSCPWIGDVNTAYANSTRCPECGMVGVRVWKVATSAPKIGLFDEKHVYALVTDTFGVPLEKVKRWDCPCPDPCGKYLLYGPGNSLQGSTDVLWVVASFTFTDEWLCL